MIKIYGPIVSPFVMKVLGAAHYKRLHFSHQEFVGIRELKKLNPWTGKVPIATFKDNELVYDSTTILQRFDKEEVSRPLVSSNEHTAGKQRLLEDWSDESLYWYNQAMRWSPVNRERTIAQNKRFVPFLLRPLAKPLLTKLVGRQPNSQGLGRLPYDQLLVQYEQRLIDLAHLLGSDQYFYGAQSPSVADFAIYGVFYSGFLDEVTPDFPRMVASMPTLMDWYERMKVVSVKDL